MTPILLFSVFVVATCGLVYELVSGALASYLLGDSVTQFSTVIGTYLFAMGVGSYISRYVKMNPLALFIHVEILIGLIGGFSAALLFVLFGYVSSFRLVLYLMVFVIGTLVGLEIPLLMQVLKDKMNFKDLISRVLSFDYIGALAASILFPLLLVPHLGLVRTSLLFGIFNVLVALWVLVLYSKELPWAAYMKSFAGTSLLALVIGFAYADRILEFSEAALYPEPILYSKTTPYQRIVLTRERDSLRLYLNSHLQFDSRDEYRYHEALVHVGLSAVKEPRHVLILGGGDGLAAREVLKYPAVQSITLVDLDKEMTELFSRSDILSELSTNALRSAKLSIINVDAFVWLRSNTKIFDFIIVDFPDPTNFSIGKLYSTVFYNILSQSLSPNGLMVVQSTSPLLARRSFWCVEKTIAHSGLKTLPYHTLVPSFGEWGFILAGKEEVPVPSAVPAGLKFLSADALPSLFYFPRDMQAVDVEVNKLNNQILVRYYDDDWSQYVS